MDLIFNDFTDADWLCWSGAINNDNGSAPKIARCDASSWEYPEQSGTLSIIIDGSGVTLAFDIKGETVKCYKVKTKNLKMEMIEEFLGEVIPKIDAVEDFEEKYDMFFELVFSNKAEYEATEHFFEKRCD